MTGRGRGCEGEGTIGVRPMKWHYGGDQRVLASQIEVEFLLERPLLSYYLWLW